MYKDRVYISKVNSSTIIIFAVVAVQRVMYACTYARTHARTCAISVASSRHLARGIFPHDKRTMSVAKRKTRAALGRKYMRRSTGMRFREERRREGWERVNRRVTNEGMDQKRRRKLECQRKTVK